MENSPFAKLSAELRNEIWKLVVTAGHPLHLNYPFLGRTAAQPNITRVCKQIRNETLYTFYHINVFLFKAWIPSPRNQTTFARYDTIDCFRELKAWLDQADDAILASLQGIKVAAYLRTFIAASDPSISEHLDISLEVYPGNKGLGDHDQRKFELHMRFRESGNPFVEGLAIAAEMVHREFKQSGLEADLFVQ